MIKERFARDGDYIVDNTRNAYDDIVFIDEVCEILNQQNQEIQELKKQLENAIVPKFKQGQQIYYIHDGGIICKWSYECESKDKIIITKYSYVERNMIYRSKPKDLVFATKEEAEAKLKQLTHQHEDKGE